MLSSLLNQVDRELVEVARRGTNSVLRSRGHVGLSSLNFSEIIKKIQTLCPTVYTVLSQMILLDQNPEKRTAPLALLYGLIVFQRCHELSGIQRVNTVLLTEGDASQEVTLIISECYIIIENYHNLFQRLVVWGCI